MKSDATIRRRLRELRAYIESPTTDPVERRIAYAMETAITWARHETVGWPAPVEEAKALATLLRREWPPAEGR